MKQIFGILLSLAAGSFAFGQSLEQGNEQLYYERYQSAENTFRQLTVQQPEHGAAWYGLTKTYLLQNEPLKASATIRTAPQSMAGDPYYQVALGMVLLNEGKKDSAAQFFNRALEATREKDPAVLSAIAQAHIGAESGDAQYALDLLGKAAKRDKRNPGIDIWKGEAYRKLLNGTEAYKSFREALSKNDQYALAYHKIGEIFLSQKNAELYVENFTKAVQADPRYAPSLYKLYAYEFHRNPAKARDYYLQYLANADATVGNEYDLADLHYTNKEYRQAIQKGASILTKEKDKVQPRLYKLIGYSYAEVKDTAQAISYMQRYLNTEADSNIIALDYASLASFYEGREGGDSLVSVYLAKAVDREQDSAKMYTYYRKLADLAKENKNYAAQAKWLAQYYTGNEKANNLDLFNWGLAHYLAQEYVQADTVFGLYTEKYPEQSFGYYWRAKSKSMQDKEMTAGTAVPAYRKLIEVLEEDKTDNNYKKWMVEAYAYLAAYEANTEKDFGEAVDYFEKVLEVDPENESAKKYITLLEKNLADKEGR